MVNLGLDFGLRPKKKNNFENMRELVTDGIVIYTESKNEKDLEATIYTKTLGLIKTRVVSGQKITSKFAGHLDSLNLVQIRLVQKNKVTLTDILTRERFFSLRANPKTLQRFLEFLFLLRSVAPIEVPDVRIWNFLIKSLQAQNPDANNLLRLFGYDSLLASCSGCGFKKTSVFFTEDHVFFCDVCSSKISKDRIIYLY